MADVPNGRLPSGNSPNNTSHEIIHYLNVENAKRFAFLLVVSVIVYHGVIHLKYDNDSCKWLLSDGQFPGYNVWQPYGCMMHNYKKLDAQMCMRYVTYWEGYNHIAFLGDSRIRQLYYRFVNLLSDKYVPYGVFHSNAHFEDHHLGVKVDFIFNPCVNVSMFDVFRNWGLAHPTARPRVVITGVATWTIKATNASSIAKTNYKANLTYITPLINKIKESTKVIWMLQDPVNSMKLSERRQMITNKELDDYNKIAIEVLGNSAEIWSSSRLVGQAFMKDSKDGLHLPDMVLEHDAQMLMNFYCNNHMNYNDGTCCSDPEPATTIQIITAAFFLVCIVSTIALVIYRRRVRKNCAKARAENGQRNGSSAAQCGSESSVALYEIMFSLAKLGLIMGYFYLCDRTSYFMKENKYYTHINFLLPFAYVMILGFFFTDSTDQTTVLNRDQTDEWKGWMQLVILIYHFTGASKVIPIYMHIRVLVSAYIFLTGYGHFTYFWKKGDFSAFRLCQVLFRMNMLAITLCLVMGRPYMFYYFVPLISFWYLVVYATMALWPRVSAKSVDEKLHHYLYMVIKLVLLATVMTLLFLSEVFFEKVFLTRPWKALFVTSDDSIHEWRFRWMLDRYTVVYGMVFAFGYLLCVKYKVIDDSTRGNMFSRGLTWIVMLVSVIGLGSYTAFTFFCRSKPECNDVHSYLTFLPIISYVMFRNTTGWLRNRYSSFFAWFGKISLELFISQYHVWLAADTHGVLVLIPGYPVLNVVTSFFIFVCLSHEIANVTGVLAKYAVSNDWKAMLRNLIIFIVLLIPVCFSEGVLG